jgi:hypothetical protein
MLKVKIKEALNGIIGNNPDIPMNEGLIKEIKQASSDFKMSPEDIISDSLTLWIGNKKLEIKKETARTKIGRKLTKNQKIAVEIAVDNFSHDKTAFNKSMEALFSTHPTKKQNLKDYAKQLQSGTV